MSETATITPSLVSEKPVHPDDNEVKFPPLPEPTDDDFDEDILEEERIFYKTKFPDISLVKQERLHCTACDRHLGCSARNESRMRSHPMLRTLVCHTCHSFYNSGEFDKGDDGSELYCRWCGQGGQVYCCSDCPIVFCAKCIKRNFGMAKIKEIENTDDWKCFKCKPQCLRDMRAVCWALLRFCDLRNKITYKTQDASLKDAYQKLCSLDDSECCKSRNHKRKEKDLKRKSDNDSIRKAATVNAVNKLPPTIQVKKFASIPPDEPPKEKKKRPSSPKTQIITPKPPNLAPKHNMILGNKMCPISISPFPKKIKLPSLPQVQPSIRFSQPSNTYVPRYRPRQTLNAMINPFGSFNNHIIPASANDNINLSLENLTQGLDMAAIAGMAGAVNQNNNDVVCTPDFPLEPLCEVTEDANDDDVECITPAAAAAPAPAPPLSVSKPPPLAPRTSIKDINTENIIQMTADDVTVNEATGGLKFRVDPQTLSSNKMYRLPDGRVFAIHANPKMPGGYSATIVAVTESGAKQPRGSTFAAKLSAVPSSPASPPAHLPRLLSHARRRKTKPKARAQANTPPHPNTSTPAKVDLKVPVEWYRYNLIDAVDALEYSLSRLQKLKNQATTMFLRSRTVEEMSQLHKTLDHLLKTSSTRFCEIRENLSSEVKQYAARKAQSSSNNVSDDDDVEILNDIEDPIFIDENSLDSNIANDTNVTNEVDLTGPASSNELNESGDKTSDAFTSRCDVIEEFIPHDVTNDIVDGAKNVTDAKSPKHSAEDDDETNTQKPDGNHGNDDGVQETKKQDAASEDHEAMEVNGNIDDVDNCDKATVQEKTARTEKKEKNNSTEDITKNTDTGGNDASNDNMDLSNKTDCEEQNGSKDNVENSIEQGKADADISEDLINTLLNDESEGASANMEIPEDFQEP